MTQHLQCPLKNCIWNKEDTRYYGTMGDRVCSREYVKVSNVGEYPNVLVCVFYETKKKSEEEENAKKQVWKSTHSKRRFWFND